MRVRVRVRVRVMVRVRVRVQRCCFRLTWDASNLTSTPLMR